MKKIILIVSMALVSTGAWGFTVKGAGASDGCGLFVADKQANNEIHKQNIHWVLGYISGGNSERERNGGNPKIGDGLDIESIALWLENYCRKNPLDKLIGAADALVKELIKRE